MPGGRGPNSNRRLLFGAGIVAGGALLLNWIFGEEEYDLGKSRDTVLLTLLLFLSYEWEWVRKRKKRKEELTYRLVFFLKIFCFPFRGRGVECYPERRTWKLLWGSRRTRKEVRCWCRIEHWIRDLRPKWKTKRWFIGWLCSDCRRIK